jgi:hypothetical protein
MIEAAIDVSQIFGEGSLRSVHLRIRRLGRRGGRLGQLDWGLGRRFGEPRQRREDLPLAPGPLIDSTGPSRHASAGSRPG